MIFPITIETCSKCGMFMNIRGTMTAKGGIYFTVYDCDDKECGHVLTVARDLN